MRLIANSEVTSVKGGANAENVISTYTRDAFWFSRSFVHDAVTREELITFNYIPISCFVLVYD